MGRASNNTTHMCGTAGSVAEPEPWTFGENEAEHGDKGPQRVRSLRPGFRTFGSRKQIQDQAELSNPCSTRTDWSVPSEEVKSGGNHRLLLVVPSQHWSHHSFSQGSCPNLNGGGVPHGEPTGASGEPPQRRKRTGNIPVVTEAFVVTELINFMRITVVYLQKITVTKTQQKLLCLNE